MTLRYQPIIDVVIFLGIENDVIYDIKSKITSEVVNTKNKQKCYFKVKKYVSFNIQNKLVPKFNRHSVNTALFKALKSLQA